MGKKHQQSKAVKHYLQKWDIAEDQKESISEAIKYGWDTVLLQEDLSDLKSFKVQSELSKALILESKAKVMSYQDMIKELRVAPRTIGIDRIIIHFNQLIRDLNGHGGYTQMHMTKEMCEAYHEMSKFKRK